MNIVGLYLTHALETVPVESRSGIRSFLIWASEVIPVDSWTANPMTSYEGKTAMVLIGCRRRITLCP